MCVHCCHFHVSCNIVKCSIYDVNVWFSLQPLGSSSEKREVGLLGRWYMRLAGDTKTRQSDFGIWEVGFYYSTTTALF